MTRRNLFRLALAWLVVPQVKQPDNPLTYCPYPLPRDVFILDGARHGCIGNIEPRWEPAHRKDLREEIQAIEAVVLLNY